MTASRCDQRIVYRLSRVWIGNKSGLVLAALSQTPGENLDELVAFEILHVGYAWDIDLFEYRGRVCVFHSNQNFVVGESWRAAVGQAPPGIELSQIVPDSALLVVDASPLTLTLLGLTRSTLRPTLRRYGGWLPTADGVKLEVLAEREIPYIERWCNNVAVDFHGRVLVKGFIPNGRAQNDGIFDIVALSPDFEILGKLRGVPDYGTMFHKHNSFSLDMFQMRDQDSGTLGVVFRWAEFDDYEQPVRWDFATLNYPRRETTNAKKTKPELSRYA